MNIQEKSKSAQSENFVQIQDVLYRCLRSWPWFLLSLAVTMSVAAIYLLRTPNVYTRQASVMIKSKAQDTELSELGIFQSGSDINNEMIMFNSPVVMTEVVKRLRLDMNYYTPGRFLDKVAYGSTLPATARLLDVAENEYSSFTLTLDEQGNPSLSDFVRNGEEQNAAPLKGTLFDTLQTPLGRIIVEPTAHFVSGTPYTLYVRRNGLYGTVAGYAARVGVSLIKQTSVVELTFSDTSTQRAEDVLNAVMTVYNENWVNDRNQMAVSTSIFINERLNVIEHELGDVDSDISSYKSEHLIPDVNAASSMYFNESNQANAQIMDLSNQLYMTRYVREYLANEDNKMQLLPSNSGIASANIESQISEYNRLLLQRNNLVANSSTENPLVVDMDQNLDAMRSAMVTSIDNQIVTINAKISNLQRREEQSTSRLAANPSQAKYLLSVERQQKVKESLYLFLLQKREENELSQAYTVNNTRLIAPPHGSGAPTSPSRKNIMLIAFAIGLLIPVVVIYLIEQLNTKIRGRKDLENVSLPLMGEIPLAGGKRKKGLFKTKPDGSYALVVGEGRRDIVNEAFRVLRTNLEFMTGKGRESNVVVLTSFNPGSGKSFIAMNLAVSLAIKQKSVLVIDGDMRHASVSAYVDSPHHGLSDFLGGREDNLKSLVVRDSSYEQLSILPVGTIPPNPTELLFSDRMKYVIDTLRSEYDYIIIDCPPIEMVADTHIISEYADRTIFVIRAGLLDKSMLPELENLYRSQKYRSMSLILNGTESAGTRSGYGYRYGYRYGYGYGYGYGSESDNRHRKKEKWEK